MSKLTLHPSIGWSLGLIGEARGLQEVWRRTKPEIILKLRESALIQSTESSNRIEGVEVESKRLAPLVFGAAKPKDRSEEEIVGYRKTLQWIYLNAGKVEITPDVIKKIHKMAQGGLVGDAGQWKKIDNEIIEFSKTGERRIRFKCTPASETPLALKNLCTNYSHHLHKKTLPDLLTISNFIFDFLCIHPFRDGNGRVSRLLTLLCLHQMEYDVGRYISLERIIETTKEDYYRVLSESSEGWHQSQHDLFPWWSYFLGHIRSGYQELRDRVEFQVSDTKTSLVRSIVSEMTETFSVLELLKLQPGLDREIIKKTLAQMKKEKLIKLTGSGRGARWKKI